MLRRLKENKKKGFTLVELIVVLVILAILAALLVPALTGYIDKAKNKSIIAETRQTVMAAQTLVDEKYGQEAVGDEIKIEDGEPVAATAIVKKQDIYDLAEVKGAIDASTITSGKITTLTYSSKGKTCVYTASPADGKDKYEVTK